MNKQEILESISNHNSGSDISVAWLDERHPKCIIVKYPAKLSSWAEYEQVGEKVRNLIGADISSGILTGNEEFFVFHVPLETKMPLGNPTNKLLTSAKELSMLNVKVVYAVIFDKFASLATKTVSLALSAKGIPVQLKILTSLEEAAEKIYALQNGKMR